MKKISNNALFGRLAQILNVVILYYIYNNSHYNYSHFFLEYFLVCHLKNYLYLYLNLQDDLMPRICFLLKMI